jgi:ABC-type branched-subunit amino acid transport system ATPase component
MQDTSLQTKAVRRLDVADDGYVLETGEAMFKGAAFAVSPNPRAVRAHLGLSGHLEGVTS